MLFNSAYNRASYNRRVRQLLYGANLFRSGKPKSDGEWKLSYFSDALDQRPGAFRNLVALARHSGARDQIEETRGSICHALEPLIGGSWGGEENGVQVPFPHCFNVGRGLFRRQIQSQDRKSTRLNSSHPSISYAVFCLKKKIINHIL